MFKFGKKHRFKINSKKIFGSLIALGSIALLLVISWFFWLKYTAPTPLAKLLPGDSTLLFFELKTEENLVELEQLKQIFTETSLAELLDLDSLGLAEPESIFDFVNRRAGIAFFGPEPDPNHFVLVIDIADEDTVLDFFENQTLPDEKLKSENYLGQKIYSYPRSHSLVFAFHGSDLLLSSSSNDLKKVASAIHSPSKRVSAQASYRTLISNLNPRGNSFGYLSENFIQRVLAVRFGGLRRALATPLLDLWQSGGVKLKANKKGLKIETRLILKDTHLREPVFLDPQEFNAEILDLLGPETKTFYAGNNFNQQLQHFMSETKKLNPAFTLLTQGTFKKIIHDWLGNNIDFEADLAPILESNSLIGFNDSGAVVGLLTGSSTFKNFEKLKDKILKADGKIAATEKGMLLPDDSLGIELVVEAESVQEEAIDYEGIRINKISFPRYAIYYSTLGDILLLASEEEALIKMIDRFTGKTESPIFYSSKDEARPRRDKSGFVDLIDTSGIKAKNIRYTRIDESEIALLKPFRFVLSSLNFTENGIALEIFLGK